MDQAHTVPTWASEQAAIRVEGTWLNPADPILAPPTVFHGLHKNEIWHSGLSQASVFLKLSSRVVAGTEKCQPQTSLLEQREAETGQGQESPFLLRAP